MVALSCHSNKRRPEMCLECVRFSQGADGQENDVQTGKWSEVEPIERGRVGVVVGGVRHGDEREREEKRREIRGRV